MILAVWSHLFPSRTQQLSIPASTIVLRGENRSLPGILLLFKINIDNLFVNAIIILVAYLAQSVRALDC